MDESFLNEFISYFPPPDILLLELKEGSQKYHNSLQAGYKSFVERLRNNCYEYTRRGESPNHFLIGIKAKIKDHKDYLFEEQGSVLCSRFDNALIVVPKQNGILLSEACNLQNIYLQKAIDHLNEQLNVSSSLFVQKKEPLRKSYNREINSRVNGFRIINQRNLYGAWELLKSDEHKFISDTVTSNNFERNFTGKTIRQRITWIESANCLHYFIDGIAGNHKDQGTGIEKEDDIWIKASFVFEKEDKTPYNSHQLSHANRKPTDLQKGKLDQIIRQMNRQHKERLP